MTRSEPSRPISSYRASARPYTLPIDGDRADGLRPLSGAILRIWVDPEVPERLSGLRRGHDRLHGRENAVGGRRFGVVVAQVSAAMRL